MNRAVKQLIRENHQIQADGSVVACGADGIRVDTRYGELSARRAVSCLVEPVPGDRVLVAGDFNDELFVIAVLERTDTTPIRITLEGDLSLGLPSGRFSVAAAHGIDLVSGGDMAITSDELAVRAARGSVFLDKLSFLGRRLFAEIEGIRILGGFFDTVMERAVSRVRRSYRTVEEIDQVRSGGIDYRAENTMSLRGNNTLMTAKELVKIDGDQIHLG
jgi:hypothetical protein